MQCIFHYWKDFSRPRIFLTILGLFQILSLFQSLLKKSLLLGCTVIWLTIIRMRNYNLHTENFTALKQHWHVYMMKYWGQLLTTKVYYLLCSIMSVAFDTIDHDVLLSYFKSYLSGRPQSVGINGTQSKPTSLVCGVPQGSVLGLILLTIYMLPLGDIIKRHGM